MRVHSCGESPIKAAEADEGAIAVHVFEASERQRTAHYKLTSTIMLYMVQGKGTESEVALGGSMTRQVRTRLPPPPPPYDLSRRRPDLTPARRRTRWTRRTTLLQPTTACPRTLATSVASSRAWRSRCATCSKTSTSAVRETLHGCFPLHFLTDSFSIFATRSETKDVVNSLRSSAGFADAKKRNALQGELVGLLGRRKEAVAA